MIHRTKEPPTLWNLPSSKPAEPQQQIPDFGPPPVMTPRMTSRIARRKLEPELNDRQRSVLAVLRANTGGLTDEEGIEITNMPNGWRSRRGELVEAGLVQNSGTTRPTKCGNPAVVWIAAPSPSPLIDPHPTKE